MAHKFFTVLVIAVAVMSFAFLLIEIRDGTQLLYYLPSALNLAAVAAHLPSRFLFVQRHASLESCQPPYRHAGLVRFLAGSWAAVALTWFGCVGSLFGVMDPMTLCQQILLVVMTMLSVSLLIADLLWAFHTDGPSFPARFLFSLVRRGNPPTPVQTFRPRLESLERAHAHTPPPPHAPPEDTCSICLESIPLDKETRLAGVVFTSCSHVFHTACLSPWHQTHKSCPNCRNALTIV